MQFSDEIDNLEFNCTPLILLLNNSGENIIAKQAQTRIEFIGEVKLI